MMSLSDFITIRAYRGLSIELRDKIDSFEVLIGMLGYQISYDNVEERIIIRNEGLYEAFVVAIIELRPGGMEIVYVFVKKDDMVPEGVNSYEEVIDYLMKIL